MRITSTFFFGHFGNRVLLPHVCFLLLVIGSIVSVRAQNQFVSGSSGADGAFSPTANQTLQIPESGVFNFTTVNIPSGVTITFTQNSRNTPVTILATGDITIVGTINVDGEIGLATRVGGKGGPGGFRGGNGGFIFDGGHGTRGEGPGGGAGGFSYILPSGGNGSAGGGAGYAVAGANGGLASAPYGIGGTTYGTISLLPLIGGSGGGGGGSSSSTRGSSGGGGGGAILLASSATITVSGVISARGGKGASNPIFSGGGGSGGAIRLIANTLIGTGSLDVRGELGGTITVSNAGGTGGRGYLRAEAYDYSAFNPNLNTVPLVTTQPNPVTVPNAAQIRIASIAGVSVPVTPKGSLYSPPDLVLPAALPNPVSIAIEAANVPADSVVQIAVAPAIGTRTTFQSTPLTGPPELLTATASINLPSGMTVITATLTVDLQIAKLAPMFIDGERVTRMEVVASLGGKSEAVYITRSGKRVKASELFQ